MYYTHHSKRFEYLLKWNHLEIFLFLRRVSENYNFYCKFYFYIFWTQTLIWLSASMRCGIAVYEYCSISILTSESEVNMFQFKLKNVSIIYKNKTLKSLSIIKLCCCCCCSCCGFMCGDLTIYVNKSI